jgi:2-C-methyl-D-erythritol 4-phosphate cytidylyltransferase/2-C-methyl-D-erythritol 2,4-cyclodiphosphate synthase
LPLAAAVIPAAGRARRFGSSENKIWAHVAGRTVLEHTLSAFAAHPALSAIVIVANAEELERVRSVAANVPKVCAVVEGGETRAASVKKGLDALPPEIEIVLVHDAARPLLTAPVIDRVLEATVRVGAAVPGLPLSDTVKRVGSDGIVRETVARSAVFEGEVISGLTAVQTPQGARVAMLCAAYAAHDFALSEPTDEASLVESFGAPVAVVMGDPANIKITRQEDVALAELFWNRDAQDSPAEPPPSSSLVAEIRTGFGYDVHRFASPEAGRKLFLGGIEIPYDRGLEGHSDADVLLHAVCDALLGAASLGDIGILFPNTDERYRGVSSLVLLKSVGERLYESGWRVVNIDATVLAEAPKLMPHRPKMQQTIAESLRLEPARISIKATTSEAMGFVGRKEGMACWAIATLQRAGVDR